MEVDLLAFVVHAEDEVPTRGLGELRQRFTLRHVIEREAHLLVLLGCGPGAGVLDVGGRRPGETEREREGESSGDGETTDHDRAPRRRDERTMIAPESARKAKRTKGTTEANGAAENARPIAVATLAS